MLVKRGEEVMRCDKHIRLQRSACLQRRSRDWIYRDQVSKTDYENHIAIENVFDY